MTNATQYEAIEQPETAQAFVDSLSVPYSAEFVPQSKSRNANDGHRSLNWCITFGTIETDYMQGIGHLPGFSSFQRNAHYHSQVAEACELGLNVSPNYPHRLGRKLTAPKLVDVLYSLVMDSDVLEYESFTDWADCFGYDSDSIKALNIYQDCIAIALKLRQLIDIDAAREAFENY